MAGKRTVIIGAGVVGATLADELSALGWTDITVVDQATCRRPAVRPRTRPAWSSHTVLKFSALRHEGKSCFLQVGGLEVATTPEWLADGFSSTFDLHECDLNRRLRLHDRQGHRLRLAAHRAGRGRPVRRDRVLRPAAPRHGHRRATVRPADATPARLTPSIPHR